MSNLILPPGLADASKDPTPDTLDRVDHGQGFDNPEDWFYAGLVNFGYMMSRSIPLEYRIKGKQDMERRSSEAGCAAFDRCISILRTSLAGKGAPELLDEASDTLENYYTNSIVEFLHSTSTTGLPERFKKSTADKTRVFNTRAAISALQRARATLVEDLE